MTLSWLNAGYVFMAWRLVKLMDNCTLNGTGKARIWSISATSETSLRCKKNCRWRCCLLTRVGKQEVMQLEVTWRLVKCEQWQREHLESRCSLRSFRTESITKYTLASGITRCCPLQSVMAARLTRLTHKIAIQLRLVAESCSICSSRSRRPVRKLLDAPSYICTPTLFCSLWRR
jgi:hypothetical protein